MTLIESAKHFLEQSNLLGLAPKHLAAHLGLPEYKARRYLADDGANWLKLLAEERKRRCDIALADNPDISFDDLAEICGYAHKQNMMVAFRTFYGMGITEWRRRLAA